MALKIRLARGGAKKRPFYRIVVAEATAPRDGRFLEKIGTYDPRLPKSDENRILFDSSRMQHWLGVGAKPTDRVSRFLENAGLLAKKTRRQPIKGLPSKKTLERLKAAEEKEAAKESALREAEAPAGEGASEEAAPEETSAPEASAEESSHEVGSGEAGSGEPDSGEPSKEESAPENKEPEQKEEEKSEDSEKKDD